MATTKKAPAKKSPAKKTTPAVKKSAPVADNSRLKSLLLILGLLIAAYLLANELIFKPATKKAAEPITIKVEAPGITTEEVAKHATVTDCWMIIDKKVYNATTLAEKHSGGAKNVSDYCGKDASAAWNTKNKAVAKLHSEGAKILLDKNLVGDLK